MSTLVSEVVALQNPGMAGMIEMGQLIKRRREQLSMRIEDLADAIDRPSSFVWRLEKGRNANPPAPEELRGLARALRIAPSALLVSLGYLDPDEGSGDHGDMAGIPAEVREALSSVEWDGVATALVMNTLTFGISTLRDAMNADYADPPSGEGVLEEDKSEGATP